MANGAVRVQSGDVISATLMNHILAQLEELTGGTPADLEQIRSKLLDLQTWKTGADLQIGKIATMEPRLAAAEVSLSGLSNVNPNIATLQQNYSTLLERVVDLESRMQVAGKVRISGFDPPEMVPVGQVLTILGTGFKTSTVEGKPSLVENLVFINNIPIYNFRLDSDASHLKIVVPLSIPGVTPVAGGAPINIRVSNNDGEAQRAYKVTPALPVTGTTPRITAVDPPVFTVGQSGLVAGEGLGVSGTPNQTNNQLPAVAFIYNSPTGPVTYVVPPAQVNFEYPWLVNSRVNFVVPNIAEAPSVGNFNAVIKVSFGNHVPALAPVVIRKTA